MRHAVTLVLIPGFLALASAQNAPSPAGKWISDLQIFDQHNYGRLELSLNGTKLTGKAGDNAFEGTFQDGRIEATMKPNPNTTFRFSGTLSGDRITGSATIPEQSATFTWEAHREPLRPSAPQTHTFEKTWSVDAGGTDPKGVRRTSGGNPLTGPFYVESALPGDTLVVHFTRIRLNRDSAISSPLIANNALNPTYIEQRKPVPGYNADWKLDLSGGFAMLAKPTDTMKDYKVPLAAMLGCVGVAPAGNQSYRSGYLSNFGGNMDYNRLREGVTVYLPVSVPGALLFVGDGHAAQGAGELTGNALETSMDIEFTLDVQTGVQSPLFPRMEDDDYLMASGIAGSLDEAFRQATTNLARWLERRYGLNAAEVSSVLGTAMVYDIAEVVDPQVHVVAKAPKSALAALKRVN